MISRVLAVLTLVFVLALWSLHGADGAFVFAILGDRTGEAQPGVFEQVWKETVAEHPPFVLTTGDSIQGLDDSKLGSEWAEFRKIAVGAPLYLTPGNHDVWSAASEQAYREHSGRGLRYGFDYAQVHVTVLDTSRSDALSAEDLAYLEGDLRAHQSAAVKIVVSHRPWWLTDVAGRNPDAPMQRLAKEFGVKYVIAGHVHQLMRFEFDGVTYISMPSAGGHLRLTNRYADGWFFGHAVLEVNGRDAQIRFEEVKAPFGEGRVTKESGWGMIGLVKR